MRKHLLILLLLIGICGISLNYSSKKNPISSVTNSAGLGRMLFYDPLLSGNNKISCATCHIQKFAFADTLKFSIGIKGIPVRRNTMSLTNLASGDRFFWDGRSTSLEEQVLFPIQDSLEMGQNLPELESELHAHKKYAQLFRDAMGVDTIRIADVTRAIAEFVRTLQSKNTVMDEVFSDLSLRAGSDDLSMQLLFKKGLDKYKENDKSDKRLQEIARLIKSKAITSDNAINAIVLCIQCHDKNFFAPPSLMKNNGIPLNKNDQGLGIVTGKKQDMGLFKVPSLRNSTLTPPYMHDGRFKTLEEVINHYNSGIENNPNLDNLLKDAEGKPVRLNLSKDDIRQVKNFLELIEDTVFTNNSAYSKM